MVGICKPDDGFPPWRTGWGLSMLSGCATSQRRMHDWPARTGRIARWEGARDLVRLLVLTNAFPPPAQGGYSEACADVVHGLVGRGHGVSVLTASANGDSPGCGDTAGELLSVRRVLSPVVGAWRRPRPAHRARRSDEKALTEELDRGVDALLVWHLRGIVKRPVRLAHARGVPVIYCLHDRWVLYERPGALCLPWGRLGSTAERLLGEPPILEEGWVCFNSAWLQDEYACRGWRPRRARIAPAGLDPSWFAAPRQGAAARRADRLLFAGRLDRGKGLDVALRALVRLRDGAPWRLTVAGLATDAAEARRLRALADDLGLGDRVTWVPAVPRRHLGELFANHDVALYPSTDPESFGLGLLEAMASGLIAVSSALGAPRQWLEHERNALIHRPGDHAALAAGLARLMADGELPARLREGGVRTARRFALGKVLDTTEALLQEVIGHPGLRGQRERPRRLPALPGPSQEARIGDPHVG